MDVKLHLGYLGLIKPEIDLINTILRTSSRLANHWVLVESGDCDAILTYNAQKDFSPLNLKAGAQIIMIKRRGEAFSGHAFYKPFRADELIDTLILIESNEQSVSNPIQDTSLTSHQTIYRLKRWPPAELLSLHKSYMLLAVYLSRGTKTLRDLVTLSGQTENFCMQFISLMNRNNLLDTEAARPEIAHANPVEIAPKKNFMSLLRERLGLSRA